MRTKANLLTAAGIVHLITAVALALVLFVARPPVRTGAALGFTATPEEPSPQPPPTATQGPPPSPTTERPTPAPTPIPPTPGPSPPPSPAPAPPPAPASELTVVKTVDRTEVLPGDSVTFVIQVCNVGDSTADNVVVSDALPSELELMSASTSQGAAVVVGNGVRAEFGSLAPGACAELTIVARVRPEVPPGTQIGNVATLPEQPASEVTVTVVSLLPESGGVAAIVAAALLVVGIVLLAAGALPGRRR